VTDHEELRERVRVAKQLGMHPQVAGDDEFRGLEEGTHYDVVAYTDWGDQFVPTVVEWSHNGTVDRLDDEAAAIRKAREVLHHEVPADG